MVPLTSESSLDLSSWYYNESSGLVVYFKKRFNDHYDAHDILTNKKVRRYTNLTLERIRELFKPYERKNLTKPIAEHTNQALNQFRVEVETIDNPSDLNLHNEVKRFLNSTQSELRKHLN